MRKHATNPKFLALIGLGLAVVVALVLVPLPTLTQTRQWATEIGPWFAVAFFAIHAVVTVAPVPRTFFTVSAGVLFGPMVGVSIAVAATTISAVVALLLSRYVGRDYVEHHLHHRAVRAINARLAERGWLAVASLRLIAPVPFSVINYLSGLSAVRVVPYTCATLIGVLPGTVGVVLLGDALGEPHPALLAVSGTCIALGVLGLIVDARTPLKSAHVAD